jgi:hypothetical protein
MFRLMGFTLLVHTLLSRVKYHMKLNLFPLYVTSNTYLGIENYSKP